jgi:pimeloyl-ACP methyl ester carboxylesterase/class 3 adenylate cyclase
VPLVDAGEIKYAKSDGVHVAYRVIGGEGPDLVVVPGFVSHVECAFEEPSLARFIDRLCGFARVTLFDKRGTGLSDRGGVSTLEERMDDIRAVMDDAGIERASFFGVSEGGPLTLLFAATYPERVEAIVLFGTYARMCRTEGYEHGVDPIEMARFASVVETTWGTGKGFSAWAPDSAGDDRLRRWWARYQRLSASPAEARATMEAAAGIDVRSVLPSVTAPTLVLHRDDRLVPIAGARYLAERLPSGRFEEVSGHDHLFFTGDAGEVLDHIEEFLTGKRPAPEPDRVLATVLFTDIAGSTQHLSEVGDAEWVRTLDAHDALVRRELDRFRGREVKNTGDGFVASFDGPIRALRCAQAIVEGAPSLGVEVRAGLHTGECELRGDDLGGVAVHLAARVAEVAAPGEVLVSRTVTDLVAGSGLAFADRGEHELRGIPGAWRLFAPV